MVSAAGLKLSINPENSSYSEKQISKPERDKMAYYVTRENLRDKCSEWKRIIQPYNTHQMELEPKNSALLVIDMQKFFLNPESLTFTEGGLAIMENIKNLI